MCTLQLSQPYSFKCDAKYEIPTALRRARREHQRNHPFAEKAFRGDFTVPVGDVSEAPRPYEVPVYMRRGLPGTAPTKSSRKFPKLKSYRRYAGISFLITCVWFAFASIG